MTLVRKIKLTKLTKLQIETNNVHPTPVSRGSQNIMLQNKKVNSNSTEFLDCIPVNLSSAICHGILAEHRG